MATILFQGDSITDGNRGRDGDPNHILGHGYPYLIAAKIGSESPEKEHVFINRGISGNRVSDLYARWNEDAISLSPDLLSILIGVNDAWRIMAGEPSGVTDRFEKAYVHLLDETREIFPDIGLVLMEPFILNVGAMADKWVDWQEKLRDYRRIAIGLANRYGALYVPLQDAFDEAAKETGPAYWLWDGVHPTTAGHGLIAREWLKVVQESRLAL
ncbi:SGNH/GDSL hydrolase family protein [Cohnella sp. WQ 127256]|uniref:SGNH/GDSL hydrolase family protein n=1 Tax=Cohnella sp. WQ 127256 TaxID=2938790 RepID=UPI0021174B8C|nr:SGNH/GDSL hydrolase family protein [Cohnella sp. WQ 127256]